MYVFLYFPYFGRAQDQNFIESKELSKKYLAKSDKPPAQDTLTSAYMSQVLLTHGNKLSKVVVEIKRRLLNQVVTTKNVMDE